jgi:NAD(P)-dependent dehydrogenase (short-subunit alcohol dehydrogenase family)
MKTDEVTVILGAASGMGRAVAVTFAHSGRLILADRDESALKLAVEELSEAGASAEGVVCDITDVGDLKRVAEAAGPFRSLVLTAGLSPTMAPAERIYEVNLRGTALVLETFTPLVSTGSAGVCFASTAGHMADFSAYAPVFDDPLAGGLLDRLHAIGGDAVDDPHWAYMVSKNGVQRLVRRYAKAWGQLGGRLTSVSPGIIDTPMGRQEMAAQPFMANIVEDTPLQRQGLAQEVARAAHFLCSDEASFISGCDLLVDGGYIGASGF